MRILTFAVAASAILLAAGCESTAEGPSGDAPEIQFSAAEAPPWAPPGTCWGKDVSPAVVETMTEQIIVQPATFNVDGTVLSPAVYKTETRQAIVQERQETWFETPCLEDQTPDFVATLQRALQARGLYRGMINGQMDYRTQTAVRRYQRPDGLDSGILSLASARKLGIVALERETVVEE